MYKIIRKSGYWFAISGALIVLSVIFIIVFGLRFGIDYNGGTVLNIKASNSNKIEVINKILNEQKYTGFQVKESTDNQVALRLPILSNEQHIALSAELNNKLTDYSEISYDTVGPSVSRDLTNKSILAVILASLGIIIYIAWAFKKVPRPLSSWKFGLCAVIAIIHDLLITIGFVALIGHFAVWMEVDALFVTALLTIMGFSVHDTIVVYDRLRENFIKNPHQSIQLITEESINQTLARSINTSLTVMIVLISMFLLGGASIRHFILTLIIGVFFGTYSSIFVASALIARWHKKSELHT